jgi:hypothetical protein
MSYWDCETGKIVRSTDEPWDGRPGWVKRDCYCCNGLQWGGDYPRECNNCGGTGITAVHIDSGAIAMWPGGPFLGSHRRDRER